MNDLAVTRSMVQELETAIKRDLVPIDLPLTHHFSPGVYGREMFMPKGAVVTGKIHKYAQLNILSKGEVSVVTDKGVKRVKAGFHMVAPPGAKRAFYAHEDSVWTVILATQETDVDKIEAHFTANDEAEYLEFCQLRIEGEKK